MDKFNNNLKQLINIIKTNYPGQKKCIDEYYNFDECNSKYIEEFMNNCSNFGNDIATKNEIIFSKEYTILNNIDFNSIWNDSKLKDEQRENIWKYLHTLYIFAYEYTKDTDFKTIVKEMKNLSSKDNIDAETQTVLNIIESLTKKYDSLEATDVENDDNGDSDKRNFPIPDVFGGLIGNLAQEIAGEIDPSKINLEDPSKLLKSLLSGDFNENDDDSGIMHLVQNISNKIQDKLSSGNLDQTTLFNEAQNMMNTFSGMNSSGKNSGNPMDMFANMMQSGMANNLDPENKEIVDQATKIINNKGAVNKSPQYLQKQTELKSTRDRLRKKLQDKQKKIQEKNTSIVEDVNKEVVDIDKLADEIDNIGELD